MRVYLINFLFVSVLFAGTYDKPYSVEEMRDTNTTKVQDPFMDGEFIEIKRFETLDFSTNILDSFSQDNLESIIDTIKAYEKKDENILVKVIGHAQERTDIHNEIVVESDTYANAIESICKDTNTQDEAKKNSNTYATKIVQKLENSGINKAIIVKEFRASKDIGFSLATQEGIESSNRVMVTMYVLAKKDKDDDQDEVLNSIDQCLDTPLNVQVDEHGCPLDLDKDTVLDYMDSCPDTPSGVSVNEKGCPFDSDNDGVLDYKDNCLDTIAGLSVDTHGCPISKELRLNFERKSSDIPEKKYSMVKDFADFLKKNPAYKVQIIGHTDSVGRAGDNMRLSFERSNAVKNALINEGIDKDRLEGFGRGELDPLETNRTAVGRAKNRRIEVKLFN